MELKRLQDVLCGFHIILLIVPYGIETFCNTSQLLLCSWLLIVPYGIETCCSGLYNDRIALLIVPYGIETAI